MRRLRVEVLPRGALSSSGNSLQARQEQPIPPFMERCREDDTLEDLYHKITERYSRLYPHRPPLEIRKLLDGYGTVLEVGDPDFSVGDAFTDSDKTESVAKFTVKVVQEQLRMPAQLPLQRLDSIPPDSSARPRKRPLGGIGYNARSSLRDFMRPADVEPQERPVGYANSNKRQRTGLREERARDDPDRPMLSRERDSEDVLNQRSFGDRDESVVRLVENSQRSPFNRGGNQRNVYGRPTSPSIRNSAAAVLSARPEFAAVPDSPPTVIRSSIIDGSQPFDTINDEDIKAESPELGQTLHNVPVSGFGSPSNGPERAMIDTAEIHLIPPLPPAARRPNGLENSEHDQELANSIPFTAQPVTGPLPRKSPLSKLPPQGTCSRHSSRPTEMAYKPVRDVYDYPMTDTENSQEHPPTPKAKRLKTSGALSTHINNHSVGQPLPQSSITSVVHPDSLSRRGSGVTEAELNWLHTQERSICKPSQASYDYAIDQAVTALSEVPDEGRDSDEVDERKDSGVEARENSRKAMEEQESKARVERERKAEAERLAKEERDRTQQERRDAADRVAAEDRARDERERKARADHITEENRRHAETERKAEADRVAEENRKLVQQEREVEDLRLSRQKADEAAAASKVNEERIAAEAKEKAKEQRLEGERKKKEKLKERKERKEREKLSAARKEEEHVAKEKEKEKEKEKLIQSEKEVAPKEIARRQKVNKDDKKAKPVKRSGTKEKSSPQALIRAEKDRKANDAFFRARAASVSSQRQSSTPLSTCADTSRDGKKASSTPLIPGASRSEQSANKLQPSTPGTSRKDTGLEVQMPLPSALKQSPSTQRRSVSFVDAVSKPILPQGTTEEDLARVRARISQAKGGSSNPKVPGKAQASIKKEGGGGKVQSKLNVTRDTKLKGRVIDPPAKPTLPAQSEIVSVSSESEKSASPFYSDPEDDPRQNGGAKAGPSSRGTPLSRPGSVKGDVTARMKSVTIPSITPSKLTTPKPEPPKVASSDDDSIQSFRSESEVGSRSPSVSRSPARYVYQTSVSRSLSGSENDMTSPLPSRPNESTESSTNTSHASTPSSHVPQSSGGATEKAHLTSRPSSTSQAQFQPSQAQSQPSQAPSQPSQASSTQISITTTQSSELVHAQSVERDLEAHLQRDISRSSVQPPSSQTRSQTQNHPSRASAPPKTDPIPKSTQATKPNPTPPTKTPSTTSTNRTTQPEPRPSTTSRFPSLTGLKKNPPKWDFKDGGAAPMPEFMKPKAKPTPAPPSSQNKAGSLFVSPNTQQRYVDLDRSSSESDNDDSNSSSSDNDVIITNGNAHGSAKLAAGGGRTGLNSRTPSTSTATRTGATGGTKGKSKYGSALKHHDVRLMKEDVDTLRNDWLTDNSIAFWEEYLEREVLSKYPNAHIILLRPSMSFMLMQTPDPRTLKDALPDFSKTTHIFLPINDCRNVEVAEGGSHWSLLLVSLIDGVAFHYDSLRPMNESEAALVTQKIGQLLGKELRFQDLEDSPQQENSNDCGVFVCVQMRHLLVKRLLQVHARDRVTMSMGGKYLDAKGGRKEMLSIIEGYRREGERRRSRSASPFGKPKDHSSKSPPRID